MGSVSGRWLSVVHCLEGIGAFLAHDSAMRPPTEPTSASPRSSLTGRWLSVVHCLEGAEPFLSTTPRCALRRSPRQRPLRWFLFATDHDCFERECGGEPGECLTICIGRVSLV